TGSKLGAAGDVERRPVVAGALQQPHRVVVRPCPQRPGVWAAASGICALAVLLGVLVTPVAVPILGGYALAALHALDARRPVPAPDPT
ncbi:hypothetical protein ABTW80_30950, partial [Micromonospora chalcea]